MPVDQWKYEENRIAGHKKKGVPGATRKAKEASADRLAGMENPKLTFGKHKGKRLSEVPLSYLEWAVSEITPRQGDMIMRSMLTAIKSYLRSAGGRYAG